MLSLVHPSRVGAPHQPSQIGRRSTGRQLLNAWGRQGRQARLSVPARAKKPANKSGETFNGR